MDHALAAERPEATTTSGAVYPVLFVLFFCSGFCSLLYQVVWVRLAFAHFGVITPVLSCVLSVFMAGLGVGSLPRGGVGGWWSGRKISSAWLYGAAELIIAIGAFAVPLLFRVGESYLLESGEAS